MKVYALAVLLLFSSGLFAQESTYDLPYGSPFTFAEFHGFVDLEFKEGDFTNSTFDQHHFYFVPVAKIAPGLKVQGELEYEHAGRKIKVDRVFIEWNRSEPLNLRLGLSYSPFGAEIKSYQAPVNKLVSRPQIRDLLWDEWTDVGLEFFGKVPFGSSHFSYDVALLNGPSGLDEEDLQGTDNNQNKLVASRFAFLPPGGFAEIGGSYSSGAMDDAGREKLTLTGVDFRITSGKWDMRGEYVRRKSDILSEAEDGYYAQGSFQPIQGKPGLHYLEVAARYSHLDSPLLGTGKTYSVGMTAALHKQFRVKGEVQREEMNESGFDRKGNNYYLQVVLDF